MSSNGKESLIVSQATRIAQRETERPSRAVIDVLSDLVRVHSEDFADSRSLPNIRKQSEMMGLATAVLDAIGEGKLVVRPSDNIHEDTLSTDSEGYPYFELGYPVDLESFVSPYEPGILYVGIDFEDTYRRRPDSTIADVLLYSMNAVFVDAKMSYIKGAKNMHQVVAVVKGFLETVPKEQLTREQREMIGKD